MNYFERQLPILGKKCQEKLKNSKVLIAGVGGLGSSVADILTRNGIGELYLVDNDVVDETNIHRQTLYILKDVGKKKVDVAKEKLEKIGFPTIVHPLFQKVERDFLLPNVDIVVDCLDNAEGKILLSELSLKRSIPFVHAGINGYFGQILSLKGRNLSDVLSFPKDSKKVPAILQVVSLVSSIQSMEVVNILCDKTNNLFNKIMFIDLLNYDFEVVNVENV
jgi:molybdopterin/thiamine biosynthesis adenylyltransferase